MKIPAEFQPKSWEMPPGARVLETSASVVARDFDGETLDWLVALVEIPAYKKAPIFWMRPMDARFDTGFVSFRNSDYELLTLSKGVEAFALRASVSTVWKSKRLARFFILNRDGELWRDGEIAHESMLVASDGIGAWNLSGVTNFNYGTALFNFGAPTSNSEFLHTPALEIWRNLIANFNDDAAYARQFVHLNEEERRQLIFNDTRGSGKEFEELLRVLAIGQDVWDEVPEGANLLLYSSERSGHQLFWDDGNEDEPVDESDDFFENVSMLRDWFFPINEEVTEWRCVRQWLQHNSPSYSITISRPTAHEQLEAKIRWREWKAEHEKI